MRRGLKALVLALAGALALSGCDLSAQSMPLPGGADVGDDPIEVRVQFRDVLDLVPQSSVKVADVSVGKVTEVALEGYMAEVTLLLRNDVELPDNAIAEIRQTSLLGEKFVSLRAPEAGASPSRLSSGDVIPLARTGRNPEVEEVLGALSLLLNGGGVAQLKTIATELNNALEGRKGSAKSVLSQLRLLMSQLDENKADIVSALEAINRLSVAVTEQQDSIDAALEELPSALQSLDRQRDDLVRMLRALNRLSDVGVRVIKASKDSTMESLRLLNPVLEQLGNAGDAFPNSMHAFLTYPFVDEVVGRDPAVARNLHMGDYTNLSVTLDVTFDPDEPPPFVPTSPPTNLPPPIDPTVVADNVLACLRSGDLGSAACQKVVAAPADLQRLRQECAKPANRDRDVCKQLNAMPAGGEPSIGLPGLPGLPRPGHGDTIEGQGPTMGELAQLFDPDLVSLLVPALVTPTREGTQ